MNAVISKKLILWSLFDLDNISNSDVLWIWKVDIHYQDFRIQTPKKEYTYRMNSTKWLIVNGIMYNTSVNDTITKSINNRTDLSKRSVSKTFLTDLLFA